MDPDGRGKHGGAQLSSLRRRLSEAMLAPRPAPVHLPRLPAQRPPARGGRRPPKLVALAALAWQQRLPNMITAARVLMEAWALRADLNLLSGFWLSLLKPERSVVEHRWQTTRMLRAVSEQQRS